MRGAGLGLPDGVLENPEVVDQPRCAQGGGDEKAAGSLGPFQLRERLFRPQVEVIYGIKAGHE